MNLHNCVLYKLCYNIFIVKKDSNTPKKDLPAHLDQGDTVPSLSVNQIEETDMMIGGVKADTMDLILHAERQERHASVAETYSEASKQLYTWRSNYIARRKAEKSKRRTGDTQSDEQEAVEVLAMIPGQTRGLIGANLSSLSETPLEDIRRQKGLDAERKALYEMLAEELDLEAGIEMIDDWAERNLEQRCHTMGDVNKLFPNLTASEVAFFPLLHNIPETFLLYGTNFESLKVKRIFNRHFGKREGLEQKDFEAIPAQLEMRIDGIAYGDDTTKLIQIDEGSETNPDDKEIVPYASGIQQKIQQLIVLSIENPRIFELIQQKTTDALTVGVGLIRSEAISLLREEGVISRSEPTVSEEADNEVDVDEVQSATFAVRHQFSSIETVRDTLDALKEDEKSRVTAKEQQIADRLQDASVVRTDTTSVSFHELVHMCGLLQKIPRCLLQEQLFNGTVHFYGNRILFADKQGDIVEDCPLAAAPARLCTQLIFDEAEQSSSTNETMHRVQSQLLAQAQTSIFKDYIEGDHDFNEVADATSYLEAVGLRVFKEHGVALQVVGENKIDHLQTSEEHDSRYVSGGEHAVFWKKMGREEVDQYTSVLDRLGPKLAGRLRGIRKIQILKPEEAALLQGQLTSAGYNDEDKVLTIYEPYGFSFSDVNHNARQERSFHIAYTIAESIWDNSLTGGDKRTWNLFKRSKKQEGTLKQDMTAAQNEADVVVVAGGLLSGKEGPHPENYISAIGMMSEKADFCSSFALYILSHDEFADAAKANEVIAKKFQEIQRVIIDVTGEQRDFSEGSLPVSVVEGGLRNQIPNLPDIHSIDEMEEWVAEQERIKQRQAEEEKPENEDYGVHDPDDNFKSDAQREADALDSEIREKIMECLCAILDTDGELGIFDDIADGILELIKSETVYDMNEELYDLLEEYEDVLSQYSEEPIEDIIAELRNQEIISEEA